MAGGEFHLEGGGQTAGEQILLVHGSGGSAWGPRLQERKLNIAPLYCSMLYRIFFNWTNIFWNLFVGDIIVTSSNYSSNSYFWKLYQNLHQKDHDQLYSSFLLWLGYFSMFIIYSHYSLSYDWPRCWNIILFLQTKCNSIIMMWLQAILNRYICWAWICISFKPNMMVPSNASGQVPLDINISWWPSVSS